MVRWNKSYANAEVVNEEIIGETVDVELGADNESDRISDMGRLDEDNLSRVCDNHKFVATKCELQSKYDRYDRTPVWFRTQNTVVTVSYFDSPPHTQVAWIDDGLG